MSMLAKAALAAALVSLAAPLAAAQQPHHHRSRALHVRGHASVPGYAYASPAHGPYGPAAADDDPYNPYAPPGAAIRAMARRNQVAPGVTNELAPDNIATASGGPSGGVPGFSGH